MCIYGESLVRLDCLKKWAENIDAQKVVDAVDFHELHRSKQLEDYLIDSVVFFKKHIGSLKQGKDWRECLYTLNEVLLPAIFKVSDNAIQVGNYYECMITYADVATKKKLMQGFQNKYMGEVKIHDNLGNIVGAICVKSDLIWKCFFSVFYHEDTYGGEHTLPDHEEIFSLQLFDVYGVNQEQIRAQVDRILFHCSINLGLNLKKCYLDKHITDEGVSGHYEIYQIKDELENVPIMFFNSAIASDDPRIQFLGYYQVVEFFFNRAQNHYLIEGVKSGGFLEQDNINHIGLKNLLKKYVQITSEKESLKLVLTKAVDISAFKDWINMDSSRKEIYALSGDINKDINLTKSDEKIISRMVDRIYKYRCSIAHAKGDMVEYVALPYLSNEEIQKEIPLMRYVAIQVINNCSRW